MDAMVTRGEVDALVAERVWQETEESAALSPGRRVFPGAARMRRAAGDFFRKSDALFGVPQPAQWHPEIDTGIHTLMVLEQAARLSEDPAVRFAALVHDLGKAVTPARRMAGAPRT